MIMFDPKKFAGAAAKGGFGKKKPFMNEGEDEGGFKKPFEAEETPEFKKFTPPTPEGEEGEGEDKGEKAPESPEMEKGEHEMLEKVIDLFDEIVPLIEKLRNIKK